jgi:hypothetical protein
MIWLFFSGASAFHDIGIEPREGKDKNDGAPYPGVLVFDKINAGYNHDEQEENIPYLAEDDGNFHRAILHLFRRHVDDLVGIYFEFFHEDLFRHL